MFLKENFFQPEYNEEMEQVAWRGWTASYLEVFKVLQNKPLSSLVWSHPRLCFEPQVEQEDSHNPLQPELLFYPIIIWYWVPHSCRNQKALVK